MKTNTPKTLASLAATFALVGMTADQANALSIWINELHYDNTGGDTGEFVEIAGTAGTDLSGHSLILYNGNGGATYGTLALAGTIDDEGAGFGALSFPKSGIQNGAPDGLALYDGTSILQFLSYEGSFTATDGAASGLTSTDLGVAESSSTAVGQSLQLVGTGTDSGDFTWSGPAAASPGSLNDGQAIPSPTGPGTPVPDGGASAALLGLALGGLGLTRTRTK